MIYLIEYTYTQPATGQHFPGLHVLQCAADKNEAIYFFESKYKNSLIKVNNISEVN